MAEPPQSRGMPLRLRRAADQFPRARWGRSNEHLVIMSGESVVGSLTRQTGGTAGDRWFWSITCVLIDPEESPRNRLGQDPARGPATVCRGMACLAGPNRAQRDLVDIPGAKVAACSSLQCLPVVIKPVLRSLPFIIPAQPALQVKPPAGDAWLHEVKFDGYRCQLHKAGGDIINFEERARVHEALSRDPRRGAHPAV
jgi:hypothetical protein